MNFVKFVLKDMSQSQRLDDNAIYERKFSDSNENALVSSINILTNDGSCTLSKKVKPLVTTSIPCHTQPSFGGGTYTSMLPVERRSNEELIKLVRLEHSYANMDHSTSPFPIIKATNPANITHQGKCNNCCESDNQSTKNSGTMQKRKEKPKQSSQSKV